MQCTTFSVCRPLIAKLLVLVLVPLFCLAAPPVFANPFLLGTLSPGDGWAAKTYNLSGEPAAGLYLDYPLTGGADPNRPANLIVATNRSELLQALAHDEPAVVVVRGTIDLNQGRSPAEYAGGSGYDLEQYQQAYLAKDSQKIAVQEDARAAAALKQSEQCVLFVGSNKSLVGDGDSALIRGGNLIIKGSNVIIRNLTFEDAIDYFPRWNLDTGGGAWLAAYNVLTVNGGRNVWIDHCTFVARTTDNFAAAALKNANGRTPRYYRHGDAIGIINGSDFITLSYNLFAYYDRSIIIGAKNNNEIDASRLRVTLHHNHFLHCRSRSPLVRYGKVHVYNNYYEGRCDQALGTRFAARIFSEGNFFDVTAPVGRLAGYEAEPVPGLLSDRYSLYRQSGAAVLPINLAFEAGLPTGSSAGWNPNSVYLYQLDATEQVPEIAAKFAGAGKPARN